MKIDERRDYEDIPEDILDNADVKTLNPRRNPYAKRLKKQVTINLDDNVIVYFKHEAQKTGISYQTLINLCLTDCVKNNKKLQMSWS